MSDDPKQPLNFRLGRTYKEALDRLAEQQDKPVGQLVREVVEEYVAGQARAAWEAEARRTAAQLGEAARDPSSDEAAMLRCLEANLEEFAEEWVWEEGVPVEPGEETGLRIAAEVQVDKIMTVPREKIGPRLGSVDDSTMRRVDEALTRFLGLGWSLPEGE